MKNKDIFKIILLLIILILFLPIPYRLKDGGSIEYKAIVYKITKYHKLNEVGKNNHYIDGIGIEIFGIEVYKSTKQIN